MRLRVTQRAPSLATALVWLLKSDIVLVLFNMIRGAMRWNSSGLPPYEMLGPRISRLRPGEGNDRHRVAGGQVWLPKPTRFRGCNPESIIERLESKR